MHGACSVRGHALAPTVSEPPMSSAGINAYGDDGQPVRNDGANATLSGSASGPLPLPSPYFASGLK